MSTGDRDYFTVEPTSLTICRSGALAIFCGDKPKKHPDGGTSYSLSAPLLLMPQEMWDEQGETMAKVARVLNENAHLFFSSAKAADAGDGWGWWAGTNDEHYHEGPFATREEAVAALYGEGGYIIEARQDPVRLADWIGADDAIELADEAIADSDLGHLEGEPLFVATAEQKADLEARLKRACDEWQAAHGLVFKPYMFTASRNEEYIAALADIDAGIVDHE